MQLAIITNNVPLENAPTADTYKHYDIKTHALMKPDMYIGPVNRIKRPEFIFDVQSKQISKAEVDVPPGLERLYLEILSNAGDNTGRSRRAGWNPGHIDVRMTNSTICITNQGMPIPVVMKEVTIDPEKPPVQMYVPQMLFGLFHTSSNYETTRKGAGTNGIGAKAANVFSKAFMIVVCDSINHKKYTQVWRNNMSICDPPVIEDYWGRESSTQITYVADFPRFGYAAPNGTEGGYPPEAFGLFARSAADVSCATKCQVIFNGVSFNYSMKELGRLYFGDAVDTAFVHYQWPPGTEIEHKRKGEQVAKDPKITPTVEFMILDTPDNGYNKGNHVSFVNGLMTKEGGVHTDAAINAVCHKIVDAINSTIIKRLTKENKGKEIDAKTKRAHTITIANVKPHISIFMSVWVDDPQYTSQTKTFMHTPQVEITNLNVIALDAIKNWQLQERLMAELDAKQNGDGKKGGKVKKHIKLGKGMTEANDAGTKESGSCVLMASEGQSAASYLQKMIPLMPGGADKFGVLPMRGKGLNAMNATSKRYDENGEIEKLQRMLGLKRGLDYTIPANFATLRYGALLIMADADVDGKHIIGLILLLFHCQYPSLLARNYVMYYRTPIIRVSKGNQVLKFYTQNEYNTWAAPITDLKPWKHRYLKGLGSSKDEEIKDDCKTPRYVNCFYDPDAPSTMRIHFDKKLSDMRKDLIGSWQPVLGVEDIQMQPISLFLNHEMIQYGIANIQRSINNLMDGFKESNRKVVFGAHDKWNIGGKVEHEEYKVAQFGAKVAEVSGYHHGEMTLSDVIVSMAQDFVGGSNNIPWFTKESQFGSRWGGGKDNPNARYAFTRPHPLMEFILRKEDNPILEAVVDEGKKFEPKTYYPIIPMVLVNGAYGIATGYSTTIPNHNPKDIIDWLRKKLQGKEELPTLLPWYRGFTGEINVIDRRKVKTENTLALPEVQKEEQEAKDALPEIDDKPMGDELKEASPVEEDPDFELPEEDPDYRPLLSMVSTGKFTVGQDGIITITELPVGRWSENYYHWLKKLIEEKKLTDMRSMSNDNSVYFELSGFTETPSYKSLRLEKKIGMSNMVLLNDQGKPIRYDTANEIIEAFYAKRLPIYQKRKDNMLISLRNDLIKQHHKMNFILAIKEGRLIVINRKKADIIADMTKLGLPEDLLKNTKVHSLTEDDIEKIRNKIIASTNDFNKLNNTSIQELWLQDLQEFEAMYDKFYANYKVDAVTVTGTVKKLKAARPRARKVAVPQTLEKPVTGLVLNIK